MTKKIIEGALIKHIYSKYKDKKISFIITKNKDVISTFSSGIITSSITLWMISNRKNIDIITVEHSYKDMSSLLNKTQIDYLYTVLLVKLLEMIDNKKLYLILDKYENSCK